MEAWRYKEICANPLYETHFGICAANLYPPISSKEGLNTAFLSARSSPLSQDIWAPGRRSLELNSSNIFLFESIQGQTHDGPYAPLQ